MLAKVLFSQHWPTELLCVVPFTLFLLLDGWWAAGCWGFNIWVVGWLLGWTGQTDRSARFCKTFNCNLKSNLQGPVWGRTRVADADVAVVSVAVFRIYCFWVYCSRAPVTQSPSQPLLLVANVWAWRLQLRNFILKHLISNVQPFSRDRGIGLTDGEQFVIAGNGYGASLAPLLPGSVSFSLVKHMFSFAMQSLIIDNSLGLLFANGSDLGGRRKGVLHVWGV